MHIKVHSLSCHDDRKENWVCRGVLQGSFWGCFRCHDDNDDASICILCKHGSVTLPANLHIYRIWFVYYAFASGEGERGLGRIQSAAKWVIVIFRHLHAATSCASVAPTSALSADERWRRCRRSKTKSRRMTARHRIALASLTSSLVRLIAAVWQPLSDK